MPAKDRKPKWKPARERINPVAITLRFDDDDGDDAGAAFAFSQYLQEYRKGEMAEALAHLAELHRLVGSLLMIHAAEANLYAGLTWEQIGQATGTTGQAAWQKWRYAPGTQDPIGTIRRRAKQERARPAGDPESVVDRESTRFQSGALDRLLALHGDPSLPALPYPGSTAALACQRLLCSGTDLTSENSDGGLAVETDSRLTF